MLGHTFPQGASFRCVDWAQCACASDTHLYLGTEDEVCLYEFVEGALRERNRQRIAGSIGLCFFNGRLFAATRWGLCLLDPENLRVQGRTELSKVAGLVAGLDSVWVYGENGLFGRVESDGSVSLFSLPVHCDILSACVCGSVLVLGTSASAILVVDPESVSVRTTIVHNSRHHPSRVARIESVCSASDGVIAVGDNFGDICCYDLMQPELLALQTFSMPEAGPIKGLGRAKGDCMFAIGGRGSVSLIKDDTISSLRSSEFCFECDIVCGVCVDVLLLVSRFGQVHVAVH